jgi:hypothetical protein
MKDLEKSFKTNADGSGLQTFEQVKRNDIVAVYKRIRDDGTTFGYEVFYIKIVKAGSPLPGGGVVAEDYVSYPGKSAFGKTAYFYPDLNSALAKFDEMNKHREGLAAQALLEADKNYVKPAKPVKQKPVSDSGEPKKRGRKSTIDKSKIKIPVKGERFEMKILESMNPDISFASLYNHVRSLLGIQFSVVDKITGSRGKPKIVYTVL